MAQTNMGPDCPTLGRDHVARLMHEIAAEEGKPEPLYLCRGFLNLTLEAISRAIESADPQVRLVFQDHFTIDVKRCRGVHARNPTTGERYFVPAHRKLAIRPGQRMRAELRRPLEEMGHEAPPRTK